MTDAEKKVKELEERIKVLEEEEKVPTINPEARLWLNRVPRSW